MIELPLQNIPNQRFTQILDDIFFIITVKLSGGNILITINAAGVDILSNIPLVANTPVIPAEYQEQGNFILSTSNDALPDYTQFGLTQTLNYATQDELEAARNVQVA